ncbi:hypothetical protein ACQUWN_21560 [Rossellomorea aquimaris]|uniref:hypothetical protein n=1 Tax=Bacillaceae TaxID=186817 RepID=UPI0013B052F3|nr:MULTISPECIES: hypothetical protein [Bacillaceae]
MTKLYLSSSLFLFFKITLKREEGQSLSAIETTKHTPHTPITLIIKRVIKND